MNKIFNKIGALMLGTAFIASCTPDNFGTVDPTGIPSMEGVEAKIEVDQTTNQVTFSLPDNLKGVMPIWIINGNQYSTQNGLRKVYAAAGTYEVEMKLMNKNGISDGSKTFPFTIDNTLYDFNKVRTLIAGGTDASATKEWRMAAEEADHFGCGPSGTTGLEWWHAGPYDKAGMGIYENRIRFSGDDKYTYDPAESGTMYVNTGVKGLWSEYEAAEDYSVPMELAEADLKWVVEGEDLFVELPAHTPFLYVPYVQSWEAPRFKVESYSPSTLVLIADNGEIAWHFTLTSGAEKKAFDGFKYNAESNMWKTIDDNNDFTTHFFYAITQDWVQIDDPELTHDKNTYTVMLPEATVAQWQAQVAIKPNSLALTTDKLYDFSCTITSSTDIKGVTVKLTDVNSGDNFVFAERVDVNAYEDKVFYLNGVNNLKADADCELFFDFGGCPANSEVTIKNIVVKDHAIDDGTVVPEEEDPGETPTVEWREEDNLLAGMTFEVSKYYAYGNNWDAYPAYESEVKDGTHTLTLPGETNSQWQCQYTLDNTGIALSPDKSYDYRVIIYTNNDIPAATVKLTQNQNDEIFLTADAHELKAFTDNVIEIVNMPGQDINNLKIVYDFGGNPADTEIKIYKMLLQEHKKGANELSWDPEVDNMWSASNEPNSFFYAITQDWIKIDDPVVRHEGRKFTLSFPEETIAQWQNQVAFKTDLSTSAADKYDFQVIITPTQDINGVTIKLVQEGDDGNFYFADRHDMKAYEPYVYRVAGFQGKDMDKVNLFLDFGGNPANTEVEIKDIILRKSN